MRTLSGLLRVGVLALGVAGLVGCGSADDDPAPTASAGSTLHYSSFGTKADIDCADGRSLDISGSNNTLAVTGTCASVNVAGADNRIRLEKVGQSVVVSGLNNTVVYSAGEPDITDHGTGNDIRRG